MDRPIKTPGKPPELCSACKREDARIRASRYHYEKTKEIVRPTNCEDCNGPIDRVYTRGKPFVLCSGCAVRRKNENFQKWKAKPGNNEKLKEYRKKRELKGRDRKRWEVRKRYGITLEEYDRYFEESSNCAICDRTEMQFVLDHDHWTGKIRGVLCSPCNRALGALGDSIEGLTKALDYLKEAK